MSYRVLALKWRPQRFSEVAGQSHISRTLSNALRTGRAAHAYLFTGPRGVGKTTMARVLAKALNCEKGVAADPCGECSACREITAGSALDVIEIDGASNRGIDDIRDLREGVRYAPARLQTKVYIIDEVHMLTSEAFNALLKTLEEPPDHVVFVLTTEVLKVPQTILSRCQRFDFARLRSAEAVERMRYICEQEEIPVELDALAVLAAKGEGSMRDALTLLDQVVATGERPITAQIVRQTLGLVGRDLFFGWTTAMREGRSADALASLAQSVEDGANLVELGEEFLLHLRNLLVVTSDRGLLDQVDGTDEERAAYLAEAAHFEVSDVLRFCRLLMEAIGQMRRSGYPRVHLEVAIAEMCALPRSVDLRRFVEAVKQRAGDGGTVPTPAPSISARLPKVDSASLAGGATATERSDVPPHPRSPATTERRSPISSAANGTDRGAIAPTEPPPSPAGPGRAEAPASEAESGSPAMRSPASGSPGTDGSEGHDPDSGGDDDPWNGVLAEIARVKPSLQGFLSGSRAKEESAGVLCVSVPGSPVYVQMLQAKDNRRILVELVQEQYGRPLGLRFESVAGEAVPVRRAPAQKTGTQAGAIQRVVDLFDGDVLGPA